MVEKYLTTQTKNASTSKVPSWCTQQKYLSIKIYQLGKLSPRKPIDELRILGVLQRIALAYGLAAVIVLMFKQRGIMIIGAAILLGYWAVLALFGGSAPYSLEGNVVTVIDKAILGASHLWMGKGIPFDPEGLLSTLPSVVNILIGFEIARLVNRQRSKWQTIKQLVILGALGVVLGFFWGLAFPINKSLWTSTFVVYTAGYFALVLAFFVWVVDIKHWKRVSQPLIVYGSNPLFIYALSGLWVSSYFLFDTGENGNLYNAIYVFFTGFLSEINASLLFALVHVMLFWVFSYLLYKKKIFIKV